MTHRYNTRFQAKATQAKATQAKATQAKATQAKAESNKCATNPSMPPMHVATTIILPAKKMPVEVEKEVERIKNMLVLIENEKNHIKRALIATRMYHFLEYNHNTIKTSERFRNIVRMKANEFIAISRERNTMLKYLSETSNEYSKLRDLSLVTQELKESCERVIAIIGNM